MVDFCDPSIEYCQTEEVAPIETSESTNGTDSGVFVDPVYSRASLEWLLFLYYVQLFVLPLIGGSLWFRDFNVF